MFEHERRRPAHATDVEPDGHALREQVVDDRCGAKTGRLSAAPGQGGGRHDRQRVQEQAGVQEAPDDSSGPRIAGDREGRPVCPVVGGHQRQDRHRRLFRKPSCDAEDDRHGHGRQAAGVERHRRGQERAEDEACAERLGPLHDVGDDMRVQGMHGPQQGDGRREPALLREIAFQPARAGSAAEEPAGHDVYEADVRQVDGQVAKPKPGPPGSMQGIADGEREIDERPAIVRAAGVAGCEQHGAERPQPADREITDHRRLVVEHERPVEAVGVGDRQEHRRDRGKLPPRRPVFNDPRSRHVTSPAARGFGRL